jgi:hypothetical protein
MVLEARLIKYTAVNVGRLAGWVRVKVKLPLLCHEGMWDSEETQWTLELRPA